MKEGSLFLLRNNGSLIQSFPFMKKYVIIAAGGSGNRMSCLAADRDTTTPKQFMLLAGKPILMHTIDAFHQCDENIEIIIVLPENHISEWEQLCEQHKFTINHAIAEGGETRFHSVKNGLALISADDANGLIAIHDGVRPLVSTQLINKVFEAAEKSGSAIPAIPVDESIRNVKDDQNKAVDRKEYRIIQTPQCFRAEIIKNAYEQAYSEIFTDEASVVEATGEHIHLVEGERKNMKITIPQDLLIAEMFI